LMDQDTYQKIHKIANAVEKSTSITKEEKVYLLVGSTGAGKSTTIHYMSGVPTNPFEGLMSDRGDSVTRNIGIYSGPNGENYFVVDTPGFGDSACHNV